MHGARRSELRREACRLTAARSPVPCRGPRQARNARLVPAIPLFPSSSFQHRLVVFILDQLMIPMHTMLRFQRARGPVTVMLELYVTFRSVPSGSSCTLFDAEEVVANDTRRRGSAHAQCRALGEPREDVPRNYGSVAVKVGWVLSLKPFCWGWRRQAKCSRSSCLRCAALGMAERAYHCGLGGGRSISSIARRPRRPELSRRMESPGSAGLERAFRAMKQLQQDMPRPSSSFDFVSLSPRSMAASHSNLRAARLRTPDACSHELRDSARAYESWPYRGQLRRPREPEWPPRHR